MGEGLQLPRTFYQFDLQFAQTLLFQTARTAIGVAVKVTAASPLIACRIADAILAAMAKAEWKAHIVLFVVAKTG